MNLPVDNNIPVHLLAACFNDTVATYKYYWFLSILQTVEEGEHKIAKKKLFSRMISNAWFTVNYFHVSFGKQDKLQIAIQKIKTIEQITIDEKQEVIIQKLIATSNRESSRTLWHFDKNVPHWFLSPWFKNKTKETDAAKKKRIYAASTTFSEKCMYALHDDYIEVNPDWVNYLTSNVRLLKDFCYWNLALYLQSKNPNVPDIPNKLIKPAIRNSLTDQRKNFWDLVLKELGSVDCIYTGKQLSIGNYAVEHFIPYSFVSHDLIWNLIPADKAFNSTKSDKLPPLDKYFNSFFELQQTAIDIVKLKTPNNKYLEEYLTIFPDLETHFSKDRYKESMQPLITIAANNGFEFLV